MDYLAVVALKEATGTSVPNFPKDVYVYSDYITISTISGAPFFSSAPGGYARTTWRCSAATKPCGGYIPPYLTCIDASSTHHYSYLRALITTTINTRIPPCLNVGGRCGFQNEKSDDSCTLQFWTSTDSVDLNLPILDYLILGYCYSYVLDTCNT